MRILRMMIVMCALGMMQSCTEPQQEFVHSLNSIEGISDAVLSYSQSSAETIDTIISKDLSLGDMQIDRIEGEVVKIEIRDANGSTVFNDIPSKYINMDAQLEISRNVFQPYFPEEWSAMKAGDFTSIYIVNSEDKEEFFIKTVHTGTDMQIGMHSEDY